jgi:hypothetical protein
MSGCNMLEQAATCQAAACSNMLQAKLKIAKKNLKPVGDIAKKC